MRSFLIAGNWKMNCGPEETKSLLEALNDCLPEVPKGVDVLICPPPISLTAAEEAVRDSKVKVGAQNVHFEDNGAYTGEISTAMLTEVGCTYVIVGHSERREYFGETDTIVNSKTKKALSAGIHPIICIGESLDQCKKGVHQQMVKKQVHAALSGIDEDEISSIVFAYEPLWAIGTGETATPEQAQEMHEMIRAEISDLCNDETAGEIRILYGGSMKPQNAESLLSQPDVDGGLIGGASLKAESFADIIEIADEI